MNNQSHHHENEKNLGYKIKLINKKEIAEGTMSFTFERPAGFKFNAGQHIEITLIDPPETDVEGNTRTFSIVNAPHEPNITVATRMRDTAFKRVLKDLPIESVVSMEGPFGNFRLHNDSTKTAAFLIGGIGITPIISMISDATERKFPHKLILLYSNRKSQNVAFLAELENLKSINPNFVFVPIITEIDRSPDWKGESGYINESVIEKYVTYIKNSIYYLSGPTSMVSAMQKMLDEMGIDSDNIRTEEFSGY